MQKLFIDKNQFQQTIQLDKNQTQHYLKVLRMTIGDSLIVVCEGKKYLYEVIKIKPMTITWVDDIHDDAANSFEINVFFGVIKTKHLELAIQKAAELNVNHFYLYYFDYCQKNEKVNLSRLEQIMVNACQQANRNSLMDIQLLENSEQLHELLLKNDMNYIAHFQEEKKYLSHNIQKDYMKIGILIGPEGGFSPKDLLLVNTKNSCIISLTNSILRAETALIYALSIVSEYKLRG